MCFLELDFFFFACSPYTLRVVPSLQATAYIAWMSFIFSINQSHPHNNNHFHCQLMEQNNKMLLFLKGSVIADDLSRINKQQCFFPAY